MIWTDDTCAFHLRDEPITEDTFKVCGECWHAFQTEDEFRNAVADAMFECGLGLYAATMLEENSTCCPFCSHDF